jgi:hypothetical protein
MVQPEMVGATRSGSHVLQAVAIALLGLLMAALIGSHAVSIPTASLSALGLYGLIAGWAYATAASNPNERLPDRLNEAQAAVTAGKLSIVTPGDKANPKLRDAAAATSGFDPVRMALLAAAVVMAISPEVVRVLAGGTINSSFYPAVIGPGDTSTYYFKKQIRSMKSYWRGKAVAALVGLKDLGEDGVLVLQVAARDKDWGTSISLKKSEQAQSATIYADVTMPAEPKLAGQEVEMASRIVYQYPEMSGGSTFEVRTDKLEESTKVTLSRPGLGKLYGSLGWFGVCGGGLVLFVACCMLSSAAGKLDGNPRQTVAVPRG